ncbi:FAD-dependent oxidoreductase [Desulfogranum mediterraneum]|uniref:FAD-dependent oxidoreductase n=1 Tax=Desulfogranum mediterraneum TaxID=160661 RepID=UPI00048E5DED|nr:FAD-dependent oxidoreductase [Desulfogranum mediterraneum]
MTQEKNKMVTVRGRDENNLRVSSKVFEEEVRGASAAADTLLLESFGQHNIGIRLGSLDRPIHLTVTGPVGQRLGCMGLPGATIVCEGSASDDVGYLNIGADIVVKGDATNGVCNAMAAGRVMIGGSIGSRGLTMTKWNPDYAKPEMWVLGSVGDTFAEFNCGGLGVICGVEAKNPDNVLGYRPCVGMVGGRIFYRGKTDDSFSRNNAKEVAPSDEDWAWLMAQLPEFLERIERPELLESLSVRAEWSILEAITPQERALMFSGPMPMEEFSRRIWSAGFGGGDPLRDLAPTLERGVIGVVETGEFRRKKPFWANRSSAAPCTFYCPIHIPTIDRLRMIREGRNEEAYEMLLRYTPFPASVCGTICPNLCIQNCSREKVDYSIDVSVLGRAVQAVDPPAAEPGIGKRVAVIGGGPAGMAVAWHLALHGVEAHIYERDSFLGGKLAQTIPWERLSKAVWEMEVERFLKSENIQVNLGVSLTPEKVEELKAEYDYVVVGVGAHQPKILSFPGHERVIPALDYLKAAKSDTPMVTGKQVVVIGAGNVGCDVAAEAYRLGAEQVTLVDIQKPLAFGKERDAAEALGATFQWPVMTREVTAEGLITAEGELIPAQTVIISIGDIPNLPFLPASVEVVEVAGGSWIKTDETGRTTDPQIFAVGDVERPGLATNALGAGKRTAEYLVAQFKGEPWLPFSQRLIKYEDLTIAHYDPEKDRALTEDQQAARCLSCGSCRDCHLCETICPTNAISRQDKAVIGADGVDYEYVSDDNKCIACGFCADTCPCAIWVMQPF